jgi:hypothetical protein
MTINPGTYFTFLPRCHLGPPNLPRCSVCSELVKPKDGSAHKTCITKSVPVLFDDGKIRIVVKRDVNTKKLGCPRCTEAFYSSKDIQVSSRGSLEPRTQPHYELAPCSKPSQSGAQATIPQQISSTSIQRVVSS